MDQYRLSETEKRAPSEPPESRLARDVIMLSFRDLEYRGTLNMGYVSERDRHFKEAARFFRRGSHRLWCDLCGWNPEDVRLEAEDIIRRMYDTGTHD